MSSSLLSACSATSRGRWLTDPVRRSRHRYGPNSIQHQQEDLVIKFSQPTAKSRFVSISSPCASGTVSLSQPASCTAGGTVLATIAPYHHHPHLINTSKLRQVSPRAVRFSSTAAAATHHEDASSTFNWEVAVSTLVAFATSAALVVAFPTSHNSYSQSTAHRPAERLVAFGKQPHSPPGGGGPEEYHSMLYAATPLSEEEEDPSNEPRSQPSVKSATSKIRDVYDVSVSAVKGDRVTMEDEYFVTDGGRFAAVFDGHGGGGVSSFLKRHLYERVKGSLAYKLWEDDRKQPSVALQAAALRCAFQEIDSDVLRDDSLKYQGSTAVAVSMHESEDGHRTLLSANIGDSRAILSRRGQAVNLTRDHKPNDESEKARILSMGETIEWDRFAKVHRVRNLSLSRAIGDRYAKSVVSGEVEIQHFPVDDDGDEFFLLASDGLWDVMTSQDVVTYVHHRMEYELRRGELGTHNRESYRRVLRRNMAKFVSGEAFRRGSADNICVIIVWLNDLGRIPGPAP